MVLCVAAASLAQSGCFANLDGHWLVGSQGYSSQPRLFFQRWKALVTSNDNWEYKPTEGGVPTRNDEGDRVYIGSRSGELYCFDARRGKVVWRKRLAQEIRSELLYHEGVLYVGATDGYLYAVDAERGTVNWKYNAKSEITAQPVIAGDRIYFTTAEHSVYALDADNGTWKWNYTRSVPEGFSIHGQGGPLLHKGSIYAGFADGYVVSLKALDGALQWEKRLSTAPRFADVDATPVFAGGAILTSSFAEGLFALDADDGLIRWKLPSRGASTPVIVGDVGYVTTPRGEAISFSVKDGAIKWRAQVAEAEGHLSDPVVHGRFLLLSSSQRSATDTVGGVWVLDRQTGKVEAMVDVGHGIHGKPFIANGQLYFLTDSGWFYVYRFGRSSP